jgi:hypothetical protein
VPGYLPEKVFLMEHDMHQDTTMSAGVKIGHSTPRERGVAAE